MSRIVINVTQNGDRFFSTSRASVGTDTDKAIEIVKGLQVGFPSEQGFVVECFLIETTANARQMVKTTSAEGVASLVFCD